MTTDHGRAAVAAGFTLVELLVVMVIVGIAALAGGLAMRTAASARPATDVYATIAILRRQAVERGVPVHGVARDSTGPHAVTALPDGSVLVSASVHVDRRTGRRADAAP